MTTLKVLIEIEVPMSAYLSPEDEANSLVDSITEDLLAEDESARVVSYEVSENGEPVVGKTFDGR